MSGKQHLDMFKLLSLYISSIFFFRFYGSIKLPYLHTYFYFESKKKQGFLENEWMSEENYKDNEYTENI